MKITPAITAFLLSISVLLSLQWSREDPVLQARYQQDLQYISEMQTRAADSLYLPGNNETRMLDRDTLFALCAKVGYKAMEDQMQRYYEEVLDVIPDESGRRAELLRMRKIVERIGGSILKRELEYAEVFALPDDMERKTAAFYAFADKCVARQDPSMEMRALIYIFRKLYMQERYYAAFLCAERIIKRLQEVSGNIDPMEKKNIWYDVGRVYFDFRDYDHAIPYLKAALLDEPPPRYYDIFNLQTRNTLGVYYQEIGQLDSSDYYFRSMLECKDRVKLRPMFDCIALSNLAANYRRRGLYREALELHKGALPVSLAEGDHSFSSGIYVGLAECYLETGDPARCKAMIDSAFYHIEQWPWIISYRSCDLYPVMARYYAQIGDSERSIAYMNSTTVANRREDEKFSALLILRANQELFEKERARRKSQLATFRHISLGLGVTAGIIFIVLVIISMLYRKKHRAYRRLAARSREWAEQVSVIMPPAEADLADKTLMESLSHSSYEAIIGRNPELDPELH